MEGESNAVCGTFFGFFPLYASGLIAGINKFLKSAKIWKLLQIILSMPHMSG